MSIALPALPWTTDVKPRLVRFGTDLTPALGGPQARINRIGSRFAVDVVLPTMDYAQGMAFVAAQLAADAANTTLTMVWPSALYEEATGATVSGAGQAGTNLSIAGLTPGLIIPPLIPFSFSDGTRNYLHLTTSEVTANSGGTAVLSFAPMLRASPPNGAAVNFEDPIIEGFVQGQTIPWEVQLARFHRIGFTLQENA